MQSNGQYFLKLLQDAIPIPFLLIFFYSSHSTITINKMRLDESLIGEADYVWS